MSNMQIEDIVSLALSEDIGGGDITTELVIPKGATATGEISAKQDLVVSGLEPAMLAFEIVDPRVIFEPMVSDGDSVQNGDVLVKLSGPARGILTAERVALNFLMHLSGIATLTAQYVNAVKPHKARIVDTRKTMPGMRILEKAAVKHGGGQNHRHGLYDGILIKDNHIAAAGSVTAAVTKALAEAPHTIKVEVEVTNLDELNEAITAGAHIVLLDNMTPNQMAEAVKITDGKLLLEASGGVILEAVNKIAASGVDIISAGALTHSAPAADMSLNFKL